MITYGFFDSIDNDRLYDANTINQMFDGLITSDGVYQNVGGALKVTAGNSGLNVNVAAGRARIKSQWIKLDAVEQITLNAPHVTLNRYDIIVLRLNVNDRTISLITRSGANASKAVKPDIIRNAEIYEMALAYVYVKAGATKITTADIEDTRPNTALCGIVSTLLQNLDTSELFNQYTDAYVQQLAIMQSWFNSQKQSFEDWFSGITETLKVNTKLKYYATSVKYADSRAEVLIPSAVNYEAGDVLLVFVNGEMIDFDSRGYGTYVLTDTSVKLRNGGNIEAGNRFTFVNIKSVIGL